MKKLFLGLTVLLLATGVAFASGRCPIHDDYEGDHCPKCYAHGRNMGSTDKANGNAYSTNECIPDPKGNNYSSSRVESYDDCQAGYDSAYGVKDMEWCSYCKQYYPAGTLPHDHQKRNGTYFKK